MIQRYSKFQCANSLYWSINGASRAHKSTELGLEELVFIVFYCAEAIALVQTVICHFSARSSSVVIVNYFVVVRYTQTSVVNTVWNLSFYNLKFFFLFCSRHEHFCSHVNFYSHTLRLRLSHKSFLNLNSILQMVLLQCFTVLQRDSLELALPIFF